MYKLEKISNFVYKNELKYLFYEWELLYNALRYNNIVRQ